MLDFLINIDVELFLFLNSLNSSFFDWLMFQISAKATWVPLYLATMLFVWKKFGWKKALFILLAFIIVITIGDQSSVHLFKFKFERLRPCFNPNISDIVHTVKLPNGRFGFVSSHATNSFAFAVLASLFFKNIKFTIPIIIWAAIVSYSRVYLGVHYPADIFGGAILGIFSAYIVYFAFNFIEGRFNKKELL